MYRILKRKELNPTVTLLEVEAPLVAAKAKAGQFVILRTDENGERIPLTIAGSDPARGAVTVIFAVPVFFAVRFPFLSTVTTFGLELL